MSDFVQSYASYVKREFTKIVERDLFELSNRIGGKDLYEWIDYSGTRMVKDKKNVRSQNLATLSGIKTNINAVIK